MSELSSIARTLVAYLGRPHLYPELARKFYKNVFDRGSAFKGKDEAENWCAGQAISQKQCIEERLGFGSYVPVTEKFKTAFEFAKNAETSCPVKMGGAGALDLIYYACEKTQAQAALETGVAYGWSSLAALLSLHSRGGKLYSSDMPYLGKDNDQYVGCVVPQDLRANWELFRFADRESLPKIFQKEGKFDFVHYDSDKSYNGRMWAYETLYPRVKKGGLFMSDDIGDNAAFMDFCKKTNLKPVIVEFDGKYAGLLIK